MPIPTRDLVPEIQVRMIRVLLNAGFAHKDIGNAFGRTMNVLKKIALGLSYKKVPGEAPRKGFRGRQKDPLELSVREDRIVWVSGAYPLWQNRGPFHFHVHSDCGHLRGEAVPVTHTTVRGRIGPCRHCWKDHAAIKAKEKDSTKPRS